MDELAEGSIEDAAVKAALRLSGKPLRRTSELAVAPADVVAADRIATKLLGKLRGQKALMEAVRLVRMVGDRSFRDGVADERTTFLTLRNSPEAAALRHVFFAERAANRAADIEGAEPRNVRTVGVAGLGLMGSGIAAAALGAGYRVIGFEQTIEAAEKGRERIFGLLDRAAASGRLDTAGLALRRSSL